MPSSRHSSSPHGTRAEERVRACVDRTTGECRGARPSRRARSVASSTTISASGACRAQLVRRRESGDPAAHDGNAASHGAKDRTRSASAREHHRVVVHHRGSGEGDARRSACCLAAMSRSYSTSRWSEVNPCGQTSTPSRRRRSESPRARRGRATARGCDPPTATPSTTRSIEPGFAQRRRSPTPRARRDRVAASTPVRAAQWAVNSTVVRAGIACKRDRVRRWPGTTTPLREVHAR